MPLWISDVPLTCINQAAEQYHIPAKLIIAVLNVERGRVGQAVKNRNGTYDLGPMQINTNWWPKLNQYGISEHQVQYDACTNIQVGAWILSKNVADGDSLLMGVGGYHSHTRSLQMGYSQQVRIRYTQIDKLINNNSHYGAT